MKKNYSLNKKFNQEIIKNKSTMKKINFLIQKALLLLTVLCISISAYAEGSKDLYPSGAQGGRAFLRASTETSVAYPYAVLGTHYVYAEVGERIALATSAQAFNDLTPASGELIQPLYSKRIDDRGSYNIVLQKEGYFTKTVTHNIHFTEPGQYRIEEALDPMVEDLAEMIQINPINFDLNKYNIRPDAAIELDKIVEIMNKYPNMIIELGAHTDCRASKAYNMRLSDNRAKASAEYIRKGITDPDRIYGKGYGESRLLNHCECEGTKIVPCSEEEHAVNRRTEFRVISTGDDKVKVKNTSDDSF